MIEPFSPALSAPQSIGKIKSQSSSTSSASALDEAAVVPRQTTVLRTLDDVRQQVSEEIALHAITKAISFDGVRIGVRVIMTKSDDEAFLRLVAGQIQYRLTLKRHLFIVATTAQSTTTGQATGTLIICGSSEEYVQRAVLLASSKFIGRIESATNEDERWIAAILDLGVLPYDEEALWDVVRKAARSPMDPLSPPPGSRGIDDILSSARAKLQRVTASQAYEELRETQVGAPTFLVDIRLQAQRELEGGIHGSLIIERNVLEWRFDPRCASRLAIADRYDLRIIVFCQEGYASSLAAQSLQQLGMLNATDIIGGYEAWKNAGLPIDIDKRETSRSLLSPIGPAI